MQYYWDNQQPTGSHDSVYYYQPEPGPEQSTLPQHTGLPFRSAHQAEPWSEQNQTEHTIAPLAVPYAPPYSNLPRSIMTPSPRPHTVMDTHYPTRSLGQSPSLTNSSLASEASPSSVLEPTSTEGYPAAMHGMKPAHEWEPQHYQACHVPMTTFGNSYEPQYSTSWQLPSMGTMETLETGSQHSSETGQSMESDTEPADEGREAMVQAILDRPRRTKTTEENAKFHCEQCGKGFRRIYNLRSHLSKHVESRLKVQCSYPDCGKEFDRKTDLARHERSVHLGARDFECPICASVFARKDTLVRHIEGSCSKRAGVNKKNLKTLLSPLRDGSRAPEEI